MISADAVRRVRYLAKRSLVRIREDLWIVSVPLRRLRHGLHGIVVVISDRCSLVVEEAAKNGLLRADVASFDMFDTLVTRLVSDPADVHLLVGLWMVEHTGWDGDPATWASSRITAESVARANAGGRDVTLQSIYDQLLHLFEAEVLSAAKEAELRIESRLSVATARGIRVWKASKTRGIPLVVTSDMYLPRTDLNAILQRAGYSPDHTIFSGDDGVAKFNRSSFQKLSSMFGANRVGHIGDSARSDWIAPARAGLRGHFLPDPRKRYGRVDRARVGGVPVDAGARAQQSIVESLISNRLERRDVEHDSLAHIGYSVLGPLLFGFSTYLGELAQKGGAKKLAFVAREGAILKRSFDELDCEVDTTYVRLSTRSLGEALLDTSLTGRDLEFLAKTPVALRAADFVRRLRPDMGIESVEALCREAGVRSSSKFTRREAISDLAPLFRLLVNQSRSELKEVRQSTQAYLRSIGLTDEGTWLVDVGWSGTIQRAVSDLVGSELCGAYIGVRDAPSTRAISGLYGWIDERRGGVDAKLFDLIYKRVPLLEVLLAEPRTASLKRVHQSGQGFELQFGELEFSPSDQCQIEEVQSWALTFVRDYGAALERLELPLMMDREVALGRYLHLATAPSHTQAKTMSRLHFDGTYGVNARTLGKFWLPEYMRQWS